MYGEKIKTIRELRGFTQEHIAAELGIAQNTYSKIETNQTKLSAGMLERIAAALGVSPMDIISHQPAIVNFDSAHGSQSLAGIDSFHAFQREFVEKMVASKDEEIRHLKDIINGLLKDKELLFEHLKR